MTFPAPDPVRLAVTKPLRFKHFAAERLDASSKCRLGDTGI
ncbi:hypothetical protein [Streptomyces albogriseolus]